MPQGAGSGQWPRSSASLGSVTSISPWNFYTAKPHEKLLKNTQEFSFLVTCSIKMISYSTSTPGTQEHGTVLTIPRSV